MAHDKLYGVCQNKCFVEVVPKAGGEFTGSVTFDVPPVITGTGRSCKFSIKNQTYEIGTIPSNFQYIGHEFYDKNNIKVGESCIYVDKSGMVENHLIALNTDGTTTYSGKIGVAIKTSGESYGFAPSWSVGTADNSDKVLTTKMANSLPSLVHSTGNETIAGTKTFTNAPIAISRCSCKNLVDNKTDPTNNKGFETGLYIIGSDNQSYGKFVSYLNSENTVQTRMMASAGSSYSYIEVVRRADNTSYATAPATPSNATGTEIATAGWVNSKIKSAKTGRIEKVKLTVGEFANATGYQINGAQVGDIVHYHIQDILGHSFIGSFEIGDLISTEEVKYSVIGDDVFRIKLYSTNLGFWFQYFMNDYMSETEFRGICALREV